MTAKDFQYSSRWFWPMASASDSQHDLKRTIPKRKMVAPIYSKAMSENIMRRPKEDIKLFLPVSSLPVSMRSWQVTDTIDQYYQVSHSTNVTSNWILNRITPCSDPVQLTNPRTADHFLPVESCAQLKVAFDSKTISGILPLSFPNDCLLF